MGDKTAEEKEQSEMGRKVRNVEGGEQNPPEDLKLWRAQFLGALKAKVPEEVYDWWLEQSSDTPWKRCFACGYVAADFDAAEEAQRMAEALSLVWSESAPVDAPSPESQMPCRKAKTTEKGPRFVAGEPSQMIPIGLASAATAIGYNYIVDQLGALILNMAHGGMDLFKAIDKNVSTDKLATVNEMVAQLLRAQAGGAGPEADDGGLPAEAEFPVRAQIHFTPGQLVLVQQEVLRILAEHASAEEPEAGGMALEEILDTFDADRLPEDLFHPGPVPVLAIVTQMALGLLDAEGSVVKELVEGEPQWRMLRKS